MLDFHLKLSKFRDLSFNVRYVWVNGFTTNHDIPFVRCWEKLSHTYHLNLRHYLIYSFLSWYSSSWSCTLPLSILNPRSWHFIAFEAFIYSDCTRDSFLEFITSKSIGYLKRRCFRCDIKLCFTGMLGYWQSVSTFPKRKLCYILLLV